MTDELSSDAEGLDDDQTTCFQELLLVGFDSETALAACTHGFSDVHSAVNHLKQQNKVIPLISDSQQTSSIPSTEVMHNHNVSPRNHRYKPQKRRYKYHSQRPLQNAYTSDCTLESKYDDTDIVTHPSQSSTNTHIRYKRNRYKCCVHSCDALSNIIEALVWYQTLKKNSNKLRKYSYKSLLNDYHHILFHHLSISNKSIREIQEEFELIYNEIIQYIDHCDTEKCPSFHRNQRDRSFDDEKDIYIFNDPHIQFFIDTLDSIHCHLLHSYDQGMKTKIKYRKTMQKKAKKMKIYETYDSEVKLITALILAPIKKGKMQLVNWRSNVQSKFFTKLPNKIMTKPIFRAERSVTSKSKAMSDHFGVRYYYHEYFKDEQLYITQKYYNLKDEMINNRIFCLNMNVTNNVIIKAQKNSNTKYAKKIYAKDSHNAEYFKIKPRDQIKICHLMSIVLFCDYYDLSFFFKATFRKMNGNESLQQMKNRHREFYHFAKSLNEAVQIFGHKVSSHKIQTYFHGVSHIAFPAFCATLYGPVSCTPMIEVTVRASIEHKFPNGCLIEFVPEDEFSCLRAFDCSWLSCYGNECEQLFFGGEQRVKFQNIRTLETFQNYCIYIHAIRVLDNFINGKRLINIEITDSDYYIIHCLMKHRDYNDPYNNYQIPKYIHSLFKTFCNAQKTITLSIDLMNDEYRGFMDYLTSHKCRKMVLFDFISRIFVHLKEIKIYNVENMDDFYLLSLISMLGNMRYIANNLITIGLYDIQYDYDSLNHEFLSQYAIKFHQQSGCKISIDIKDRLIYDKERHIYTKHIDHTDLIIIRNKYFMSTVSDCYSDIYSPSAASDSGDTWSSSEKYHGMLHRISTV